MRRVFVCLGLVLAVRVAFAAGSAQGFIDGLLADYRTMKPGGNSDLSPADVGHNEQVRKNLLAHIDVEKLGRLSLADHWETLAQAKRDEFLTVLHNVLEQRSISNIRATREHFEVQYDGVDDLDGGEALVKTILQVKNDEYYVDFKVEPQGESWKIYDVITDDVSTIRNYRDQFNKIIAEKGFDELLRRMRENLIEEPTGHKKKESESG
jgi:ABC-type transporter MlaC component